MAGVLSIYSKNQDSLWRQIEAANSQIKSIDSEKSLLDPRAEMSKIYASLISKEKISDIKNGFVANQLLNQTQCAKIEILAENKLSVIKQELNKKSNQQSDSLIKLWLDSKFLKYDFNSIFLSSVLSSSIVASSTVMINLWNPISSLSNGNLFFRLFARSFVPAYISSIYAYAVPERCPCLEQDIGLTKKYCELENN